MKGSEAKLLAARVLIDDIRSVRKGWYFRFAKNNLPSLSNDSTSDLLAEYKMKINWVESLGEINLTRIKNISLGAELVNNTVLKQDQIFSLRRALGNATEKRGFGAGPVIKHGVTTTTIGGGLCLVSSILFNVALLSDLTILEKYNHRTDLWGENRFVGLGLDATYAYGILDLKIANNKSKNVLIKMGVNEEERYLWCEMWGTKETDLEVEIESRILEEILPEVEEKGKELRKGWKVRTIRYSTSRTQDKKITYDQSEVYQPFYVD